MLPLQNVDEEWENGGMFCNLCPCMWVCLGGKAADWTTHVKWEEPNQEVKWRNDDIMEKPRDFPQRV